MQRNLIRILCLALVLTLCFPMVACDTLGGKFGQLILNLLKGNVLELPEDIDPETLLPETLIPETMVPQTNAPATQPPRTEVPVTQAPETQAPTTKPPRTEEPTIDEPTVDEPTVDEPTIDEPTIDEPTIDEPTIETEPPIVEPDPVIVHVSFDELDAWIGGSQVDAFFAPGQAGGWNGKANVYDYNVEYIQYRGWVAFYDESVGAFGYQIDNNEPVFSDEFATATEDIVIEVSQQLGGKTGSRMTIAIPVRDLSGEHTIKTLVKNAAGAVEVLTEFTLNKEEDPNAPIVFGGRWHASVDSFMYCVNDDFSDVVNFMAANTNSVIGTTMTGADSTLSSITANYIYWENGWLAVDGYALENLVCNIYAADGTLLKTVGLTLREAEVGLVDHVFYNMRYADGTVAHRVGQADGKIISLKEFSGQTVSLVYSVDLVGAKYTLDLIKIDVTVPEAEKPEEPSKATQSTISFADLSYRTEDGDEDYQIYSNDGFIFAHKKGESVTGVKDQIYINPIRLYTKQELTFEFPGMTKLVIVLDETKQPDGFVDAIADANVTTTIEDFVVTVEFAKPVDSFTVILNKQIRMYSATAYNTQ